MGCWNETCGLSQLPIREGEEAVLVVLSTPMRRFADLTRRSDEDYTPVSLPLYGTYNDYGTIEPDPAYADYHAHVHKIIRMGYSDAPEDFSEFLDELPRGIKSKYGELTAVLFKRPVWDKMVSEVSKHAFSSFYLEDTALVEGYRNAIAQGFALVEEVGKVDFTDGATLAQREFTVTRFIEENFRVSTGLGYFIKHYIDFRDPKEEQERVTQGLLEVLLITRALRELRLGWTPQFGGGSQDAEIDLRKVLVEQTLTEIDKIEKWYDEDEEDYDDDNS